MGRSPSAARVSSASAVHVVRYVASTNSPHHQHRYALIHALVATSRRTGVLITKSVLATNKTVLSWAWRHACHPRPCIGNYKPRARFSSIIPRSTATTSSGRSLRSTKGDNRATSAVSRARSASPMETSDFETRGKASPCRNPRI